MASPLFVAGVYVAALAADIVVVDNLGKVGWYVTFDPLETSIVGVGIGVVVGALIAVYALVLLAPTRTRRSAFHRPELAAVG